MPRATCHHPRGGAWVGQPVAGTKKKSTRRASARWTQGSCCLAARDRSPVVPVARPPRQRRPGPPRRADHHTPASSFDHTRSPNQFSFPFSGSCSLTCLLLVLITNPFYSSASQDHEPDEPAGGAGQHRRPEKETRGRPFSRSPPFPFPCPRARATPVSVCAGHVTRRRRRGRRAPLTSRDPAAPTPLAPLLLGPTRPPHN